MTADPRRRFAIAATIGGVAGFVCFLAMVLSAAQGSFFRWQRLGDFYDAQAHAFLRGDLAVDPYPLGIEAFFNDGRAYLYQGPTPALFRVPFVAVAGDRLDGRLTALSMSVAMALVIVLAARLHWRVRQLLRGDAAVSRFEMVVVAATTFLVGGSMFLFHGSRVWVYHEAIAWGAAFALAAIDQLIAFERSRRPTALLGAATFATLALWSRASIGIGPLVGLAVLAAVMVWRWLRSRDARFGEVLAAGAAAALPLVAYAAVNVAKFETLFSVPFWDQRFSQIDEPRQEFLELNGGTFFGLQFVPTTLLRYLLPTGFHLMRRFPFVDLADPPTDRVSLGTTFDVIDRAAGVPVAQPLLFLLALAGLVAIVRRAELSSLRIPVVAAAASAATIFPFGYIAYRYLADAAPFLLLCAAAGGQWLLNGRALSSRRSARVSAVVVLAALSGVSLWMNGAAGLQYQRVWSAEDHPGIVAGYLEWKTGIDEGLGVEPPVVERGSELPNGLGRPGAFAVIGDCEALYISDGEAVNSIDRSPWNPVEHARSAGHIRIRVTLPEASRGERVPLFAAGDDTFDVVYVDGSHVRIDHESDNVDREGLSLRLRAGDRVDVEIHADPRVQHVTITAGDVVALDNYYFENAPLDVAWPRQFAESRIETPLCDRLTDSGR